MNKLVRGVVAALTTLLSAGAMAQAHAFFSASVGLSNLDVDCSGASYCDKSSTGFKMVGGYDFGSGLSGEVGYLDFGKARLSGGGLTIDVNVAAVTVGAALQVPLPRGAGLNMRM